MTGHGLRGAEVGWYLPVQIVDEGKMNRSGVRVVVIMRRVVGGSRGACSTTVRGLNVHQRQHCDLFRRMDKSEYEVEKVLAARGPTEHRFYLLKYKGYGPEYNKWSPDGPMVLLL